jgi:hypothetical protein
LSLETLDVTPSSTLFAVEDNARLEKYEIIRSSESSESAASLVAMIIPSRPEKTNIGWRIGRNEAVRTGISALHHSVLIYVDVGIT